MLPDCTKVYIGEVATLHGEVEVGSISLQLHRPGVCHGLLYPFEQLILAGRFQLFQLTTAASCTLVLSW